MLHATTVLAVRHGGHTVMASDGQVTFGDTVMKQSARKIRKLYNDRILAGFAGSAADSFALFSRFEAKLEQYRGNLDRSAVELAKEWRTDRFLRRLEAMLIVMDAKSTFLLSGNGDLIEPDDGIIAIGSGGAYALAAAKALAKHTAMKVRTLHHGQILAGFAGAVADALTLFERFESHLEKHHGQIRRAAVELAKDWRTDRILRRLEAMLIVMDARQTYLLSGNGDLIEPDDGIIAIGSGGGYALAAAKALARHTDLDARAIAAQAMDIAAAICIYTNATITIESL